MLPGGQRDHRPYEGSQLVVRLPHLVGHLVIIAPTRGRNICSRARSSAVLSDHRPYEGLQHRCGRAAAAGAGGDHRPYEGSQLDVGPASALSSRVIIAPTRGRNSRNFT